MDHRLRLWGAPCHPGVEVILGIIYGCHFISSSQSAARKLPRIDMGVFFRVIGALLDGKLPLDFGTCLKACVGVPVPMVQYVTPQHRAVSLHIAGLPFELKGFSA
ncbi:hypothetical protein JOB18_025698 [Solea senegalensis]|uniref:Uncharacterized protein n=1 Tax=Solea senegalensis TaxID=28829 RepID=A0AAV6S9F3_SOLSE|nr:hypothetical protein JOB18_025698 [Solea senegalensis]